MPPRTDGKADIVLPFGRPSSAASGLERSQKSALGCSRSAYPTALRPFLPRRTILVPTPTIALTNNQNQTLSLHPDQLLGPTITLPLSLFPHAAVA